MRGASAVVLAAAALPATANVCEAASSGSCEEREAKLPPDALRTNGNCSSRPIASSRACPRRRRRGELVAAPLPPLSYAQRPLQRQSQRPRHRGCRRSCCERSCHRAALRQHYPTVRGGRTVRKRTVPHRCHVSDTSRPSVWHACRRRSRHQAPLAGVLPSRRWRAAAERLRRAPPPPPYSVGQGGRLAGRSTLGWTRCGVSGRERQWRRRRRRWWRAGRGGAEAGTAVVAAAEGRRWQQPRRGW